MEGNRNKTNQKEKKESNSKLKVFNPEEQVKLDSFIIVNGQRRYGKTIWTRWVLSKLKDYFAGGGYVFTKSKHNLFWSQHFPNTRIYNGLGDDNLLILAAILEKQRQKHEKMVKSGDFSKSPYIVIILDDVIADQKSIRWNKMLNEIVFTGRHFNVLMFILSQDVKGLPPNFHNNADIIALTFSTQKRQLEVLEQNYGYIFHSEGLNFLDLVEQNTHDHRFLVIDRTVASYNSEDMFFVSKAKLHVKPFQIGSDKFWKESQCSWKRQLEIYENQEKKEDMEKKNWLAISKKQFEEEKEEQSKKENMYNEQKAEEQEEIKDMDPDDVQIDLETDNSIAALKEKGEDNNVHSEYEKILRWVEQKYHNK
jgi:hypothetical protein